MQRISIAVVIENGCVLIGRRGADQTLAGSWEFPGGKVHPEESFGDAAARECLEETGLMVEVGELLWEGDFQYDHGDLHLRFYRCSPTLSDGDLANPFRWVRINNLPQYEFPAANSPVLAKLSELA